MGKESKPVKGSNRENFNNLKSETYKQIVKKEEKVLEPVEQKNFQKHAERLLQTNNYLAIQKKDPNSFTVQSKKFKHPLEQFGNVETSYCQKCKKDGDYCLHKKMIYDPQEEFKIPITSSQNYGWRKPIDDSGFNYGMKNILVNLTSNLRENKKKE